MPRQTHRSSLPVVSKNQDDQVLHRNVHYNEKRGGSCCGRLLRRCMCLIVTIGVVIGGATLLAAHNGNGNPLDYFVPVDPPGRAEAVRWDATSGLTLTVENAMDESYVPLLVDSVRAWNETDALNIVMTRGQVDPDCKERDGRLKVCNGDYGNTDWRGINVVVLDHANHIMYSVAKINDYHMYSRDHQVYTICHELGHGFGLPHTDENHFNLDRGDCMDYTERPRRNGQPGLFNLNLLEELYGTPTAPLSAEEVAEFGKMDVATDEDDESAGGTGEGEDSGGGGGILGGFRPEWPTIFGTKKGDDDDGDRRLGVGQLTSDLLDRLMNQCTHHHCSYFDVEGYRVEINKVGV